MYSNPGRVILYLGLLANIILKGKRRGYIGKAVRKAMYYGILENSDFHLLQQKFRQGSLTMSSAKLNVSSTLVICNERGTMGRVCKFLSGKLKMSSNIS